MTAQLELPLGDDRGDVAAITDAVLRELEHLLARPEPEDDLNARCRAELIAGRRLLLDWLDGRTHLPDQWQDWPCCACMAAPGQPCDLPNRYRVDKWITTPPDEQHHLGRGRDGRWASRLSKEHR